MIEHTNKIFRKGFRLSNETHFDTWYAEKIVLQIPMSINAIVGSRRRKLHELSKRQCIVMTFRK